MQEIVERVRDGDGARYAPHFSCGRRSADLPRAPGMAHAVWFRVSIADGGVNGLTALGHSTFDLMIVDIFIPNMRGFEIDPGISPPRAQRAADCEFRIRLFGS